MENIILKSLSSIAVETAYFTKELVTQRKIYPLLDYLPDGNGRPVYLIPGLANDDHALHFIKKVLSLKGFEVATWGLGMNLGPTHGLERRVYRSFRRFYDAHGPSSVVGHSLGGCFAVAIAHHSPEMVDRVITMAGVHNTLGVHPGMARLYRMITGKTVERSWSEATHRGTTVASGVPVFHIVGTMDTLLSARDTCMDGNLPSHVFPVQTSHVGLLESYVAAYTLVKLLDMKIPK